MVALTHKLRKHLGQCTRFQNFINISKQQRLNQVCAYVQTCLSLGCLHTKSMDVDGGSDQNLDLKFHLMSVWAFIRGICTHVCILSTEILCADQFVLYYIIVSYIDCDINSGNKKYVKYKNFVYSALIHFLHFICVLNKPFL